MNLIRSLYQPYIIRVGQQFVGRLRCYVLYSIQFLRAETLVLQTQPHKLQTST